MSEQFEPSPFEPDFDPAEERRVTGPIARGDLIATLILLLVAAISVGVGAAVGLLMLALEVNVGAGVAVVAPGAAFLAGALVSGLRLRARRTAWWFAAGTVAVVLLLIGVGAIWWAAAAGLT